MKFWLKMFWPEGLQLAIYAALIASAPLWSPALAQTAAEKDNLSVADALNVAGGLGQLQSYETVDKDGKPSKGFFAFSADTTMLIALNIQLGRNVQTAFERAVNDVKLRLSDGSGTVPDEKRAALAMEIDKLMSAPSRVGFYHIALKALCMKAEGDCKAANPIPPPTLSLILPIVDR